MTPLEQRLDHLAAQSRASAAGLAALIRVLAQKGVLTSAELDDVRNDALASLDAQGGDAYSRRIAALARPMIEDYLGDLQGRR